MDTHKKEKIKLCIAISIILFIFLFIGIIMIKYQVEGESNMPFNLSKISIISTAEGVEKNQADLVENKWNFDIYQNNDIYFSIEKNENYDKKEMIESISIENIKITKAPQKGIVQTYMPNSTDGRVFTYDEKYIVNEKLNYAGATRSDYKTLEIGNQGGTAVIRFSNRKAGEYVSNEEEIIKHDGTLFAKTDVTFEQLQFEVNFDFIISLTNKKYKANITLEMPCGNILTEGTCTLEKSDMKDVVFKRI